MGEYARFSGREIKIGTWEDMYYLRFSQRGLISPLAGNVDPACDEALSLRFRFPWPDEDAIEPGGFEDFRRSVTVWGAAMPKGVSHYSVQFVAQAGYLCSLPCPESEGPHPVGVHRNGFAGAVRLTQQKLLADGRLVPVCTCGGCGASWRLEDSDEIQALAQSFLDEGQSRRKDSWVERGGEKVFVGHEFWHKIANRILAGAGMPRLSDLQ